MYDAFGDRWSKLTFVIYLTDDFEGGSTTFFCPARVTGCLEARGVNPSRGSVSPLSTTQSAPCDAKIPIHPLFHQVRMPSCKGNPISDTRKSLCERLAITGDGVSPW